MPEKLYEYLLGVAVLVIAYFLRQIHSDFKSYILDLKKVKDEQNDLKEDYRNLIRTLSA